MKLYEINERIASCVDVETGEIIDEQMLQELEVAFDEKVENIALWIKNLTAEAKAIKEEKDSLAARQKACENKAESLKNYLALALAGESFKTPKVVISFRKSKAVQVDDASELDDDYLKYAAPTVDKAKVKKALEAGVELRGVRLVTNQNIQVK